MAELKIEVISIEGVIYSGVCSMAVVPSASGEVGIMKGHESIISSLRSGEIQIYDSSNNIVKAIQVKSGFAEMQSEDKLLVLINV